MNTLSVEQLKKKVLNYINGDISSDDMSKWAANIIWKYEKRTLDFIGSEKKMIRDIIIDLTYANVKGFADSKEVLKKKLEEL